MSDGHVCCTVIRCISWNSRASCTKILWFVCYYYTCMTLFLFCFGIQCRMMTATEQINFVIWMSDFALFGCK